MKLDVEVEVDFGLQSKEEKPEKDYPMRRLD